MSKTRQIINIVRGTVFMTALLGLIVGTTVAVSAAEAGKYLGPKDVVATKDGKSLLVLNVDAKQVAAVDVATGKVTRSIALPANPTGMVLAPNGATLYVTCAAPQGTVCLVDVASGKVAGTIPAGHGATGPSICPAGKRLFVCNRFDNNVSVIDTATKKEIARVPATRDPIASAVSLDGKSVFVSNLVPNERADAYDVAVMITVIDTASNKPASIRLPNGSTSAQGICVSADGKYAYVVHVLARYQMPTTQLERGWMNTNAMSVIDVATKKLINTVLLDDVDLGAANPFDVACTPDGKYICVTHAGTHELSVIDAPELLKKLLAMPKTEEEAKKLKAEDSGGYSSRIAADVPNDLAFLVGLRRRIRLAGTDPWSLAKSDTRVNGPRGMAIIGSKVYIAVYFGDLLAVVDLADKPAKLVSTIPLGPAPVLTAQRRGEMNFHDAALCFQNWQSCSSCHPDARVDGLNWDLMNDGMGNPKNVKSMLLAHKTPPSMISGVRPTGESAVRSGITHIQFAVRPDEDAQAIDAYLKALQPVPSPRLVGGQLSEAAKRGKALFFSKELNCGKCHPEPLYTDLQMHDVKSKGQYDRRDDFDTPTLIECWRTAPYMHDGRYVIMKEVFTTGKHGNVGGALEKLNEQQLNDLCEFVLSL